MCCMGRFCCNSEGFFFSLDFFCFVGGFLLFCDGGIFLFFEGGFLLFFDGGGNLRFLDGGGFFFCFDFCFDGGI